MIPGQFSGRISGCHHFSSITIRFLLDLRGVYTNHRHKKKFCLINRPSRNRGLIFGLKVNQWGFHKPDHEAGLFLGGGGVQVTLRRGEVDRPLKKARLREWFHQLQKDAPMDLWLQVVIWAIRNDGQTSLVDGKRLHETNKNIAIWNIPPNFWMVICLWIVICLRSGPEGNKL